MATTDDRLRGGGSEGVEPRRPAPTPRGIIRDPVTGEESLEAEDWRPDFQARIAQRITNSLWMIIMYMFVGALVGMIIGLVLGQGVFALFRGIGLLDGIQRFVPEALDLVPYYYMFVTGLAGLVFGMGWGMRRGVVNGNVAVTQAVLVPAIQSSYDNAPGPETAGLPRGAADRMRAVHSASFLKELRARMILLEDHIEGFGITRLFRRYVAAQTVDYLEDIARTAAAKLSEGPEKLLYKEHFVRLRDAVVPWMRNLARRKCFLILFTLMFMPILGAFLLYLFPALTFFLVNF
jgi:hypothetical protein